MRLSGPSVQCDDGVSVETLDKHFLLIPSRHKQRRRSCFLLVIGTLNVTHHDEGKGEDVGRLFIDISCGSLGPCRDPKYPDSTFECEI